jgi:DNA-directed RNA polymerase subunit M/transcription elongation factor TFIIS
MPATLDVSCPNCGKQLKVPAELEGKKVKCKDCQEVFAIKAPKKAAAAKPAAPKAAPKPAPKPAPPPAPEPEKSPFLDEDDDENLPAGVAPKPMEVIRESDAPRCPHCAKELDPPTATVCKSCGYNNKTRIKHETKKVIASDAGDWASHLGPGIIAAVIAIGLIVVDIFCWVNMSGWIAGSALEKEGKNPVTGDTEYYVKPGAFIAFIIAASLAIIVPATRFAFRRLVMNAKPLEKVKK